MRKVDTVERPLQRKLDQILTQRLYVYMKCDWFLSIYKKFTYNQAIFKSYRSFITDEVPPLQNLYQIDYIYAINLCMASLH